MATIEQWTPYGVALNITATAGTVRRISATQFTVVLNTSWTVYWNGTVTNYGMWVYANDVNNTQKAISPFGTYASSGSTTITGTYSISGTSAQTKSVTVTFENYNSESGASASRNITLSVSVPAWSTYSVKYNANGGSGAPSAQTKIYGKTLKLSSVKPTRTGYTFQGWGTTASDTTVNYAAGANYTANAAITLYAIWKINTYTIRYDLNGGTGNIKNQSATYGSTITLSSVIPTKTDDEGSIAYEFKGWATSATASRAAYTAGGSYVVKGKATLYAVWGAEVTKWDVVFNANGGTGAPEVQVKDKGVTLTLSSDIPTKIGHRFVGWATSATATTSEYSPGSSYSIDGPLFLYAVWSPFVHSVNFDLLGGENSPAGFTSIYGQTNIINNTKTQSVLDEETGETFYVEEVVLPVKEGFIFRGWNTAPDGTGMSYQMGDTYTNYQDGGIVTLYAVWVAEDIRLYKSGVLECLMFRETENLSLAKGGIVNAPYLVEGDHFETEGYTLVVVELVEK